MGSAKTGVEVVIAGVQQNTSLRAFTGSSGFDL